jgi:hypothetical protein
MVSILTSQEYATCWKFGHRFEIEYPTWDHVGGELRSCRQVLRVFGAELLLTFNSGKHSAKRATLPFVALPILSFRYSQGPMS